MRTDFKIQQALFGYESGHHLLSSSIQLSAEVRHLLAVATDLSGSAPPKGFETTFTGLPLTGTNFYALFCTWLAIEMPRPGCVWSQVLFIELADFAEIEQLGTLRNLFRRPTVGMWAPYSEPIYYRPQRDTAPQLPSFMESEAEKLVAALYLQPAKAVVFVAPEERTAQDLVFELWSQQWPRLRRNFRFSTGSFADRGRTVGAFDLQVSPEVNRRSWQREGEYLLVDSFALSSLRSDDSQLWVHAAVQDLLSPDAEGFRSFLRSYGADVNRPRQAYARLALAYAQLFIAPKDNWIETLRSIGTLFEDPIEALALKEWLVNPPTRFDSEEDAQRNLAMARFLLASFDSKPYQGITFDVNSFAESLWQFRKKDVLSLLADVVGKEERLSVTTFADAVTRAVKAKELRLISEDRPELIPFFITYRQDLAFEVETWRLPTWVQWRIHEVLNLLSLEPRDWGKIAIAMFNAGTDVGVRETVRRAGSYAIDGILDCLESDAPEELPSETWRDSLAPFATDEIRTAYKMAPVKLAFCSWFVAPEIARQLDASRQDVQDLGARTLDILPRSIRVHAAFLLVTIALRKRGLESMNLLARGFFIVHNALATGNYSSDSWLLLYPDLPQLGIWSEWDRCKKLRRAIQERTSKKTEHLAAKALLETATSPEHLALVRQMFGDI
jgi:hypothetical protein